MLEVEVRPGKRVSAGGWRFALGTPLAQLLQLVELRKELSPWRIICDPRDPRSTCVVLSLESLGLELTFDPKERRLSEIVLPDVTATRLVCRGQLLHDPPRTPATLDSLQAVLADPTPLQELPWAGEARAGRLDSHRRAPEGEQFTCEGLLAVFCPLGGPEPSAAPPSQAKGAVLRYLEVFKGTSSARVLAPVPSELSCLRTLLAHISGHGLEGLRLFFRARPLATGGSDPPCLQQVVALPYGQSCQDLVGTLGPASSLQVSWGGRVYALCYPDLGMAVVMDPDTNTVRRFRLFAGLPGHPAFARFSRCPFSVCLGDSQRGYLWVKPLSSWSNVARVLPAVRVVPRVHDCRPRPQGQRSFRYYRATGVVFCVADLADSSEGVVVGLTLFRQEDDELQSFWKPLAASHAQ